MALTSKKCSLFYGVKCFKNCLKLLFELNFSIFRQFDFGRIKHHTSSCAFSLFEYQCKMVIVHDNLHAEIRIVQNANQ